MRKYLLYGVGEILLIIIGIMIALQIDNWNTDRQQEALLKSYLHSIARNMRDDAEEIEKLRDSRAANVMNATRASHIIGRLDYSYKVAEIYFFNKVAAEARQNLYFNADTSGYEALNTSGISGRLQGRGIERLLSKYYDQVNHIADVENRLNELLNALNMEYLLSYPEEIAQWQFREPRAMAPDRFYELQPSFAKIINGAAIRELFNLQLESSTIIREYNSLLQLGASVIGLIESGSMSFEDAENASLAGIDQVDDWALYSKLVTDGQLSAQFYNLRTVSDGFEGIFSFRSMEKVGDTLRLQYPGSDSWAVIWLGVFDIQEDRAALDFSRFDKLVLELRAESGSETITVHIKDRFLPDTQGPESVDLQITDAWQFYEIDLATFENTDLSNLITPLGFTFFKKPQSFFLRNAGYVISD